MRVTGLKVAIFASTIVALVSFSEYSLLNAAHASTAASVNVESPVAAAPVVEAPAAVSKRPASQTAKASDYESYVQVFDEIGEDPEHAEARMVTASYAIN